MNEMIQMGQQIPENLSIRDVIRMVMDHALATRPKREVCYKPFRPIPGVGFQRALGGQQVDLDTLYPDAEEGDTAFVDFDIRTETDYEIYLNVSGAEEIFFEGESVHALPGREGESAHIPVTVRARRRNTVRLRCTKQGGKFYAFFLISVRRYPSMWANDYLFWARAVSPHPDYAGEEGVAVSPLFRAETAVPENIAYRFPEPPRGGARFNFNALCGRGDVCYVYTEAAEMHTLSFSGTVTKVLVNGEEVDLCRPLCVQPGDKILFRCAKQGENWFLQLADSALSLSFLRSGRPGGDRAIFVGPFSGEGAHGPEYGWTLSRVFANDAGERLYWRFCDGSQLRAYLDSVFYGQWFYALMVGFYGIRRAAQLLGDAERQRLFCDNMCFLAEWFDYIRFDIAQNTMPAFMPRIAELTVLDNIGTMGMNLIDAFFDCSNPIILPLAERLAEKTQTMIPRLANGAYHRGDTMWADDLYMSCPFLIRMGRLTGDTVWYQRAADQIMGFREMLYMEDERLFSHIYFPAEKTANRVAWGRGNGWVMWTLSELLSLADGKIDLSAHRVLFCEMSAALRRCQTDSGLWRQVLNRSEEGSYLETSCTAMFLLAFVRGVKNGWLDDSYLDCAQRAWEGLKEHSIDRDGNVYGVCMGSGCAKEAEYYFSIPTIVNDDHGTGVVLAAASELCALLEERGRISL